MKYIMLVYNDPALLSAVPQEQFNETMRGCLAHADELKRKGTVVDSQMLQPASTAKSVRVRFRNNGGKLLIYHGWSDSALSPLMSIRYYDQVMAHDATAKNDVRMFMLPGVLHCAGGPGPDRVDYLDAIDKWANGGAAPEELTAGFAPQANGQTGARKVCAWPKKAAYKGACDGKSPDQFECR